MVELTRERTTMYYLANTLLMNGTSKAIIDWIQIENYFVINWRSNNVTAGTQVHFSAANKNTQLHPKAQLQPNITDKLFDCKWQTEGSYIATWMHSFLATLTRIMLETVSIWMINGCYVSQCGLSQHVMSVIVHILIDTVSRDTLPEKYKYSS